MSTVIAIMWLIIGASIFIWKINDDTFIKEYNSKLQIFADNNLMSPLETRILSGIAITIVFMQYCILWPYYLGKAIYKILTNE